MNAQILGMFLKKQEGQHSSQVSPSKRSMSRKDDIGRAQSSLKGLNYQVDSQIDKALQKELNNALAKVQTAAVLTTLSGAVLESNEEATHLFNADTAQASNSPIDNALKLAASTAEWRGEIIQDSFSEEVKLDGRTIQICSYVVETSGDPLILSTFRDHTREVLSRGIISALEENYATIEFDLDGNVINANHNFCATLGYTLSEVIGQHHSIFVPKDIRASNDYKLFWKKLASGEVAAGKFRRIGKGGQEVWLQAAYNPVKDRDGNPFGVVKIATDITDLETQAFDLKAVVDAISLGQSVFEISVSGDILHANSIFERFVSAQENSLIGNNILDYFHDSFRSSEGFAEFWSHVTGGRFTAGTFAFVNTNNDPIHAQGAFTPVRDRDGNVFKLIACLTDVTAEIAEKEKRDALATTMSEEQAEVVDKMRDGLAKLADGDLTVSLNLQHSGDYSQLSDDFNEAVARLEKTICAVVQNAEGIRSEAGEINGSADELAERTETQAATLEETSASLEELTASVKSAAEGAAKASENVSEAKRNAEGSGAIVDEAISAMSEIENSSRQISKIIGVIDDIAFQTNLLALNAGVEAARAGDAGRGFAVVASEVRALAQRSSEAAKEIKSLISTSTEQVSTGVELVGRTGTALKEIVSSVASIAGLVGDIANTSKEQSTGISQINSAVTQIDQVTQQNTAMVQKSTSASHSMMQEAEQLSNLVAQFKVNAAAPVSVQKPATVTRLPSAAAPPPVPAPQKAATATAVSDHIPEIEPDWDEF